MTAPTKKASVDKAARRKRFEDVFPVIAEELLGYIRGEGMPQDAVEWYEKVSLFHACRQRSKPSATFLMRSAMW